MDKERSDAGTIARPWMPKAFLASSLLIAAVALFQPINNGPARLLALGALAAVFASVLALVWRRRAARWTLLALPVAALLFPALPGRPADPQRLRTHYLDQMAGYKGTPYVWGGEGRFGIDCSGLVRRGLLNANVRLGLAEANPRLLRRALEMWWFDSSAKALRDGYRDQTTPVVDVESLNGFDHEGILPGDLACTQDGRHVLAYVGDRTWISASGGRVAMDIRAEPPNEGWFSVPVRIVRWRELE